MNDPLIVARAVHFAATLSVAGAAFFQVFIAAPALRAGGGRSALAAIVRRQLAYIAWIALPLCAISGAAWLVITAQSMSGVGLSDVFSEDVLGTVLLQTGFGQDWIARFVLLVLLAGMLFLLLSPRQTKPAWLNVVVVALTAGLTGSLAWAGHAVGAEGLEGIVHPAADFVHLVAAAAWVGTLLPLALLLAAAGHDATSLTIARIATMRFSTIGVGSVALLMITGSINTWYLAGSIPALTETDYGRLLLLKIALFLVMVAVAAFNRLHLTPRLVHDADGSTTIDALRRLRRNASLEVAIGAIIIAVVAALGTNPPGFEAIIHAHHVHE
ncbi:MAG TPA: copper homeostasis membrane protein CopD [Xanthobacteraceae bacterium]|nr:copper homeostasis membrane protein CopD [Xanthobacteraceae bacterium]